MVKQHLQAPFVAFPTEALIFLPPIFICLSLSSKFHQRDQLLSLTPPRGCPPCPEGQVSDMVLIHQAAVTTDRGTYEPQKCVLTIP